MEDNIILVAPTLAIAERIGKSLGLNTDPREPPYLRCVSYGTALAGIRCSAIFCVGLHIMPLNERMKAREWLNYMRCRLKPDCVDNLFIMEEY